MSDVQASVLADVRNHIGYLTLNRPAGLNALTLEMVRLLKAQLEHWMQDQQVRTVLLSGAGDRAFCAGGDIRTLYDEYKQGSTEGIETFFSEEYALDQLIHAYPKPVIALMDRFVLGGGMGLAQGAGLRMVTERSRLGMPETGIGYFPDVGGSYFLPRLPGELGIYLGVTGVHIGPADALYAGLADVGLPSNKLPELTSHLDDLDWSRLSPEQAIRMLTFDDFGSADLKRLRPAIDRHFAHKDIPSIRQSLLDEQNPEWHEWAQATVKLMDSRSPIAMAVTLELLRRGRELSLADCFAMELHLDRQWFDKGDIVEGVRALLVDKDKNPRWNPASIDGLDPAEVAGFFKDFNHA